VNRISGPAAIFTIFIIIAIGSVFSCGSRREAPESADFLIEQPDEQESGTAEQAPSRAERVMKALSAAYPRQIEKVEFRDNDWVLLMRDTWYYYADGRLLPENLREKATEYRPVLFYQYLAELPPWVELSPEESARLGKIRTGGVRETPRRSTFLDDLWQAHNRNEAYERVKSLRFLGNPVMVHYAILEDLSLVEERILAAARTDPEVRAWINNIGNLVGWNWRNVAGTQSRSFHSYGAAVDILPSSPGGRAIYWLWAGPNWWNIPYERRYHPPDAVIKAFESYGFVWGGK